MAQNNSTAPAAQAKGGKILIAVAVVLVVITLALWVYQNIAGFQITNMRNLDSWGLYITNFMFMVGLSAGGLIISSAPTVFNIKGFEGIAKVAIWCSICCTVLAMAFVVIDMGQPLRVWELLFVYSNWSSPLMWDIVVLLTYLILSIIYLVVVIREERGLVSHVAKKAFSLVALVVAVAVHSVTAWVFALNVSREFWHTALMAPWFVVSALASGLALVIVVCIILSKRGYVELGEGLLGKLARLLGVFVIIDLYFLGCDVLTGVYGNNEGREIASMLLSGSVAPVFWAEVLCGIGALVICFWPKLRTRGFVTVAAVLAILSVFCKRCLIILTGFGMANLDAADITSTADALALTGSGEATASAFQSLVYFPAPFEMLVTLCVLATGIAVFAVGLKYLPLRTAAVE